MEGKCLRILHISTAHQPYDPRIVYKQCPALTNRYEVFCAIPNADPSVDLRIRFIRLPYFKRVLLRTLLTCPLIVWKTFWLRPAIIHIYVPEFLPFAYLYKWTGTSVIYEVQENLFKKMHLKAINRGWLLERIFRWFDVLARRHFYFVFTEHGYLSTYANVVKPSVVIYNYPELSFLDAYRQPYRQQPDAIEFFYIGWLSFERAFDTLLEGLALLKERYSDFRVHLFGRHTFELADLESLPAYRAVREQLIFYGYADQHVALPYAANAVAGLALIKPVGDYPESYTTKMFEYMALGIPVVTSNFPLYQDVVGVHHCGFCVDPCNPVAIADALSYLIENRQEAQLMGQRGQAAAEQAYNWASEAQKLEQFYQLVENN